MPTPAVPTPATLRPAATVVIVRAGLKGPEVLMLLRAEKGDHNSGAWVFPGGLVDRGDRACHACCAGLDDAEASRRLGLAAGGLDFYVTAIRESFEEAGLLLAIDDRGAFPALDGPTGDALSALRKPIGRGELDFGAVCRDHGLRLATDRLHYIAHWITPPGMAKRFDTRFFLAVVPPSQRAAHDAVETLDHGWFRPADLLAGGDARKLLVVTRTMLQTVAGFDDVDGLLRWAESPRGVKTVTRRRCRDAQGPQVLMPDHPAWPEVGLLDPEGEGTAWCELRAGVPVRLSPLVRRFTHGDGNCYLIGDGARGWAVIDPPPSPDRDWLLALTGGREPVALSTGEARGVRATSPIPDLTLEALDTPGGTAWLLRQERMLFTGRWAPPRAELPPALGTVADWMAPARGFLVPLR
ncbi:MULTISPECIES: NUDIX hydrolase [Ramlibacter]|uniref:NUDIX hydrolase n=1 Tax=Ramlibacter pinisoli TaxID=2682844 RepID=A0A6N8J292_9BURK|nr:MULTISPECIES: NUDIX domain-containing protein [Ramlibacter]MBA2962374.1 NUDIX domain-containing protein [Ramlibacter sp. CGMCC 1.13660]MVQ32316.1 NUDIX hydrolase [Ramlibacter pinisoli]